MVEFYFQKFTRLGKIQGVNFDKPKEAIKWFRRKADDVKKIHVQRFFNARDKNQMTISDLTKDYLGKMALFFYDPKHKETLPYYDTFPLIFPIEFYENGFLGINLHYLPNFARAKLMDALYTIAKTEKDGQKRLEISYKLLKGAARFKYFEPCIKRYLYGHVRSKFIIVPHEEWDLLLMLPLARFKKQPQSKVWKESMQKARGW